MKRLLNIKDREKVESGEYKVTTRSGRNVRVICWDTKGADFPIIALVMCDDGSEIAKTYTENGVYVRDEESASNLVVEVPDEKIPFDISYKEDILAGKVKVQTGDGRDVRIISFDGPTKYPVVGVCMDELFRWTADGKSIIDRDMRSRCDLVIIKSE